MISHLHRAVFVHVPKTAGKTVLALFGLPLLGKDYDGGLAHLELPYGHRRLSELRARPGTAGYLRFGFVRNPWDRLLSAFAYLDAGGCNPFDAAYREKHLAVYGGDFGRFVRNLPRHLGHMHFRPQAHWLDGEVDMLGRQESFEADIRAVAARIGLAVDTVPRLNASRRGAYRDSYDAGTRDLAAAAYAEDIARFGYAF